MLLCRQAGLRVHRLPPLKDGLAPRLLAAPPALCGELLALADEIEAAPGGDPRIWADVEALLRDAIDSPLLNEALPEDELAIALRSLLYRVATDPRARGRAAAGDRSVNDTAWSRDRRAPRLRWRHEPHGDAGPPPGGAGGRRRART